MALHTEDSRYVLKRDKLSLELVITSVLLGVGLAMDAFSVSLANGLADKDMRIGRMLIIAGTFAGFQFAMPMIGWVFVHTAESKLEWFSALVPWIALLLLLYIGGKMLKEGIGEKRNQSGVQEQVGAGDLIMQGIATSIDALSVGFTIAAYSLLQAVSASITIGVVTLFICLAGLKIGRKLGTVLAGKASILGGIILIGIGLEIWIRGVFF